MLEMACGVLSMVRLVCRGWRWGLCCADFLWQFVLASMSCGHPMDYHTSDPKDRGGWCLGICSP